MEHEQQMHSKWKPYLVLLLVINLLLLVYLAFFKRDSLWLETLKVGGSDNMKLVQQLYQSDSYKEQQKTAIQQILDTMGTAQPTAQQPTAAPTTGAEIQPEAAGTTISADQLAAVKKDAFVDGNANAKVTVVVYSDLLCPFCKRQSDAQISEQLLAKYGNDVNIIFKHYIVHPAAEKLAEAADCVGDLAGVKAFYKFVPALFDLTDTSDASVLALAKTFGVKEAAFTTCLTSGKFATAIANSTTEGRTLFAVSGTPGSVIIDNAKGTFTLIAGAYPIDTFTAAIDAILAK